MDGKESNILSSNKLLLIRKLALVVKNGLDIIPRVDGTYENEIIYYDPVNEMIVSAENTWIGFKALSEPFT